MPDRTCSYFFTPKRSRLLALALASVGAGGAVHAQGFALEFDSNGRLEFPHNAVMLTGTAVTLEFIVRFAAPGQVPSTTFQFQRYADGQEHKTLGVWTNGAVFYQYAGSPWYSGPSGSVPGAVPGSVSLDGVWHHVAFARHPDGTWQTFVDGAVIASLGPGTGLGSGCWVTCGIIGAVTKSELFGGPGWQVRALRISTTDRYSGGFTPSWTWTPDPQTAMLLAFSEGAGNVVHDTGPAAQVGTLTGGFQWVPLISVEGTTGVKASLAGTVNVTGNSLDSVTGATIGGQPVAISSQSPTSIDLQVAPSIPGTFDLELFHPGGEVNKPAAVRRFPVLDVQSTGIGGQATISIDNGGTGVFLLAFGTGSLATPLALGPEVYYGLLIDPTLPYVVQASGAFPGAGTAQLVYGIPNEPSWAGLTVPWQAWCTDGFFFPANPASFSNLAQVVLN